MLFQSLSCWSLRGLVLNILLTLTSQKKSKFSPQFVHYVMTKKVVSNKKQEMWFKIYGKLA